MTPDPFYSSNQATWSSHMIRSRLISFALQFAAAVTAGVIVANTTRVVLAHGAGGDIGLWSTTVPGGEKIDVGFAELDDDDIHHIFFDRHDEVFNNILLPRTPTAIPPIPWTLGTQEPGLDANEGELAPVQPLTLNVQQLTYWNGSGAVNFGPLPPGVSGGYAPQPSLTFADGGHHSHPIVGIMGGGTPNGVYLFKVIAHVNTMIDSDPYYKVSLVDTALYTGDNDQNAENAEALGELVRAYVADPVNSPPPVFMGKDYTYYANAIIYAETLPIPEPATLTLLAVALLAAFGGRRRAL
jgi:hypothetical protein